MAERRGHPSYLSFLPPSTVLPTSWSTRERYPTLELSHQNLRVEYRGAGKTDSDAAAARANAPIPPQCGVFYFETKVVSKGRDGYISLGFMGSQVPLNRLPGWENNSYGYHADDGHRFAQSSSGTEYGPLYSTDDVVGCCLNFAEKKCFYTLNGIRLRDAFTGISFPSPVFPAVGLRTPGEVIETNFGQSPFVFDIEGYVQETREASYLRISSQPLASIGGVTSINELVRSYLAHHGYSETARVFARSLERTPAADQSPMEVEGQGLREEDEMAQRKEIRQRVLAGDIVKAIQLTNHHFPRVLKRTSKITFQLRCRHFVELILQRSQQQEQAMEGADWLENAMEIGQQLMDDYYGSSDDEQRATLEQTFSLLAYANPRHSPVAHLLDTSHRETVASLLNSEILVSQNRPATPPLERLVMQAGATMKTLQDLGAAPSYLQVDSFLTGPSG